MKLKLEIKRVEDGKIATDIWPNFDYSAYWWEDGNAACDCNRQSFFSHALGEDEPEDTPCGDGRFLVRLSDADTAEILYNEFDKDATK